MVIVPNYVYAFTFKSLFSSLNGIYRVESIMSYAELINSNIDLYKITYKANNVSEDIFKTDLDIIRAGKVLKLVLVTNEETIVYIPDYLFDKIPDGSVQKYFKLGLAVTLGIFDNIEDLNNIKDEVDQIISSMTGNTNKTAIFTVKGEYMTTDQYKTIDDARNLAITRISNHYTDKQKLLKEIDSLKTKLKYYEDLLISTQ